MLAHSILAVASMISRPSDAARTHTYAAVRIVDPIVIDGAALEQTWQRAPADDRFSERQPHLGAPPPVRTVMQVAYDDLALYVFIRAEAPPNDVVVRTLRRDNTGIYSDDAVYVKIDPQHDRRTSYSFGVNADGAQIDTLALEDGRDFINAWDGVWEAATQRTASGYTAEFRIPFAIVGIKRAREHTMGFNITRDHPSRNATYDWRLIVPPRSPMSASQFGDLVGLRSIEAQRALEYTPYVLLRTNFRPTFTVDPRLRPNFATGGDVRLQIGAASYAEASLLTDFAQVEADEVQVARDRFPLFFPERRPFFINGLDVFNFGRPEEAQLFFSRRVGLVGGQPVPILGGAKVYGRGGPLSYGLLHVQTLGSPSDPQRGIEASDPDNITVARMRVQLLPIVNVGMMVLGRHRFDTPNSDHAAAGVDMLVNAVGGKLQWYSFVASTFTQTPATAATFDPVSGVQTSARVPSSDAVGSSAFSSLEYRGLFVRPALAWLWSDRDFAPDLGFYRRTGATKQDLSLMFVPRPRAFGVREVQFGPRYAIETDANYRELLRQATSAELRATWNNGASIGYELAYVTDRVQQPFVLYLHEIAAARYHGMGHSLSLETPSRRALGGQVSYEYFQPFGGRAHQASAGLEARLGKHVTLGGRYTHLVGHFADREDDFNFGFANADATIAINRNVAFDNLLRVDLSPEGRRIGFQSRLRWRFLPGSDLFVVYRTDQPLTDVDPFGVERTAFHELTVKLSYYMRAFIGR